MKNIAALIIIAMIYSISIEAAPSGDLSINDTIINDQLIDRQALILEIVKNQAPIKSEEDLLRNIGNPKSPINRLSPSAKEQFLDSIVFTENGIGGFLYGPLLELPKGDI